MARLALIVKAQRKPKFKSRVVTRCERCGRVHGFLKRFKLCRICFRELSNRGMIPGVKKASW